MQIRAIHPLMPLLLLLLLPIHRLRTPNEAFFHQHLKLLGLGRQFGRILFGAFGVFSAKKGQLISKGLFGVIVRTKKPMKFFKDFCPSL
jgi:hypothetical protein